MSQNAKFGKEKQDEEALLKKQPFDLGLTFGLGYETPTGFFIDGRYVLGLTSCYKDVDSFQNRSIQFSLGYKFQL